MKKARVLILAVALSAALGAGLLAKRMTGAAPEVRTVETTVGATEVLVAAKAIALGDTLQSGDMKWQKWPKEAAAGSYITRDRAGDATKEFSGAIARSPFLAGEPITAQKIVKPDSGGVMAAILPSGMRAISTPISEASSAGGFILPNDRVDVVLSRQERGGRGDANVTETVLRNVRVLAIGEAIEQKGDSKIAKGKTATLELTPRQTEILVSAQARGDLSLALRSLSDASPAADESEPLKQSGAVKFLKYGVPSRALGVN
jgi:pilus assembly protein CpaB